MTTKSNKLASSLRVRRQLTNNLLFFLILLATVLQTITCQQLKPNISSPKVDSNDVTKVKPKVVAAAAAIEIFPSSESDDSETNSTTLSPDSSSGVLLSASEFVDFTETPTILFDGTSNEEAQPATESNDSTNSTRPVTVQVQSTSVNTSTTTPEPISSIGKSAPGDVEVDSERNLKSNNSTSNDETETEEEGERENEEADGPVSGETVDEADDGLNANKPQAFTPPQNVSQYMDYIERLQHDLRHQITDLFEPHIPQLIRTSQMVQLTGSCSYDMLRMALALRQFEPWALRMIDSSGKVPEGIFEGSFTALGSYDECLATVFGLDSFTSSSSSGGSSEASQTSQQQQALSQTQGKYCLVNVSPFLPPKPPADRVERIFQEEANRRNYTKDDQFSRLSPMFYYMKFRIGVCIPSTCVDSDMESISSALSSSLRLNITIPHCRVKQEAPLTVHQLIGGLVFALVVATVLGATLMDFSRIKLNRLKLKELEVIMGSVRNTDHHHHLHPPHRQQQQHHHHHHHQQQQSQQKHGGGKATREHAHQQRQQQRQKLAPVIRATCDNIKLDGQNQNNFSDTRKEFLVIPSSSQSSMKTSDDFYNRLNKHWTWMSFSLLTNYKLYFLETHARSRSKQLDCSNCHDPKSVSHRRLNTLRSDPMVIRCLNGIRVLSLCWVIVANSYITLDPRATKRLTKTREASKDFLFQMVVQASLAIETFFFLSGVLMSLSFVRKLRDTADSDQSRDVNHLDDKRNVNGKMDNRKSESNNNGSCETSAALRATKWIHFYIHRYIRMTPPTMLVIALTMFAFRYGDGPLWFEATHKAHLSCSENWWRHLLHVANFIDTRQMCFIHYWYIAADMQLFLFAPILMFLIYKRRRLGYALATLIGLASMGSIFYITYMRNLPPTLLFYNSDPESRREFGNTIMTKPLTHALPYMVGMLAGKWLIKRQLPVSHEIVQSPERRRRHVQLSAINKSAATLFGLTATLVALAEVFLPYQWNNSRLPTRFLAALYAALFRFCWSLALAYLVMSCQHKRDKRCRRAERMREAQQLALAAEDENAGSSTGSDASIGPGWCNDKIGANNAKQQPLWRINNDCQLATSQQTKIRHELCARGTNIVIDEESPMCSCGSGGNLVNRLLSLSIFTHLSKLSFVAYLIHLPLMSVFVAQTRGLFAFSHMLVIHLALSYLVMTFLLSFVLVHIIEFPFLTFERYLCKRWLYRDNNISDNDKRVKRQYTDEGNKFGQDFKEREVTTINVQQQTQSELASEESSGAKNNENYKISERL